VVNKYELPVPTKIHIAKNNSYLLAYVKVVISETVVRFTNGSSTWKYMFYVITERGIKLEVFKLYIYIIH
jgi:hypothetical protein